MDKLRDAGLFRMAVPRSLGGQELDPVAIVELVEQVSAADGSAGWTTAIGNSAAFFAWLEPSAVREMVDDPGAVVSTGTLAPIGRARRSPNGKHFVLTGRWPFNSGCVHADWFQVGFLVVGGDGEPVVEADGTPEWRIAFLPSAQGEVIDTWRAAGLRGTGSHDVAIRNLRVPIERTTSATFEEPLHEGPLLRLGFRGLTGALLAGFPLGVARRALDELTSAAPSKRRQYSTATLADDRHVQLRLGEAEGSLEAARSFVITVFGDAWATISSGEPLTVAQRARMMLALQHAMDAAVRVVDAAHEIIGASTVYDDHPIGRCFRDIHAARQHYVFSGEMYAEYARLRFGAGTPSLQRSSVHAPAEALRCAS